METSQGETPDTVTDTEQNTDAQGETPAPETLQAESESEPANGEQDATPAEPEEPAEDPVAPLKSALRKERDLHKAAAAEVKELREKLLDSETRHLVRDYHLSKEQDTFLRLSSTIEERIAATKAIDSLRVHTAGKNVIRNNANVETKKKPVDGVPMFKR